MQFDQLRRREFLSALGATALGWPLAVRAQQPGSTRSSPFIGYLLVGQKEGASELSASLDAFQQGLRELGYTEGQNITIERRYAEWKLDQLPDLAAELVRLKVDVIVAFSTSSALAAKQATSTIPIVAVSMAFPVEDGLVASLARPGGNVTGTTFVGPELIAKRMGLLKETIPGVLRVAALWHPRAYGEHTMADMLKEAEGAARTLGVQLQLVQALGPNDFDSAFSAMTQERADAFVVLPSPMLWAEHRRIVALAAKSRLPAMYQAREFVDAGGLMSYGTNLAALFRHSATYVDKILKGTKPADLPVEQPTKFELVINLKTAKALNLEIPPMLLARADEVIE
jgi:putative tryptophan/tyrosine transport system substrate-binding protein